MENQGKGYSSPISCEVLDIDGNSAREESQSRRKLEFEDRDDLFNVNVPNEDEDEDEDESEQDLHNSVDGTSDINLVHSNISDEAIPKIEMKFLTEEVAFQFYNAYAYKVGFSVRRSKEHKDASGKLVSRIFCCSCEGKRGKNKRDSIVKSHRPETRFGCLARMKIKYCRMTEQYYVAEFAPVHNHTVSTPSKTHLHRSHRKFGVAHAAQADLANDSGIAPRAVVEFMARQVGGVANLGFIPQDYKNYLRSKRTVQMKVGDTGGVLEYLQKKQLEDPNFFYAIQVDEDDLITNIFWADAKMMADYAQFRDVVCFDTTYRKNKDGRPFAMFVGVNHHKHAASIYTPDVFVLVQRELSKAHDCKLEISEENETITKYEITPYGKHRHHVVTYDSAEDTVMCSCKKFEFGGILCSHALKVLSSNNVVRIPDQYILKRWTKNAKSRSIEATCASSPVEDPKAMMGIRYKELCRLCTQMATRAAETEEAYKIALNALKKISEDVDASLTGQTFHETSHANMSASQEINEAIYGEESEKRVKGLKVKERTTRSSKRPRGALQRAVRSKRAYSMNIVPVQESEINQPSCFSQEAPMGFTGTSCSADVDSSYERNLLSQCSPFSQQHEPCTFVSGMGALDIYQMSSQPLPIIQSTKTVPTTMTELLQAPLSQAIDEEFLFNSFEYESQRKSNDVKDRDGDTFFK